VFRPAGQKGGKKVCDLGFSERTRICIIQYTKKIILGGVFMNFDTIESAIEDIRQGKMIVVVDDEDRKTKATC